MRPYLKKNSLQKRAGGVAQGEGPEFKCQYHKEKKIAHFLEWIYITRKFYEMVQ
jgi:hypothetical protein